MSRPRSAPAAARPARRRTAALASLLLLPLLLLPAGSAPVACNLLWGHSPSPMCLLHGELSKEGLAADSSLRSFAVGYEDVNGSGLQRALLVVRDPFGALLSKNLFTNGPFNAYYAGLFVRTNGSEAFAVGTQFTSSSVNPCLLISRWTPGSGGNWTTPVNANSVVLTPAALGLAGSEAWGCRVIKATGSDLFVAGCSDVELFVARIDRLTLQPIATWGVNGVQRVASNTPNGCPKHASPGAFLLFNLYPWSFVELEGNTLYLGGTLMNDLPGVPIDFDFVAAAFDVATGAPVLPFGVQYSRWLGDDFMHAMAAAPSGLYAAGTFDPNGSPEMQLVAWQTDGTQRPPFLIRQPTPSRGNDVEVVESGGTCHIYVGGYGGFGYGTTWHYTHASTYNAPVVLPALWSGGGSGPNPKPYGPLTFPYDEVYDLSLGTGTFAGHVFAVGRVELPGSQYGQTLQCIAPNGAILFSNNPTPLAPSNDHAVACLYVNLLGGNVFTSGTAFDPGGSFLVCPAHWAARMSRYKP